MRAAWLVHGLLIVVLTALSQVGGVIYVAALLIRARLAPKQRAGLVLAGVFAACYAVAFVPIERLSALSGRAPLPCVAREAAPVASSLAACVLHRHYAKPELVRLAVELAAETEARFPGTVTRTLDASFPFFDGFPIPPHLSHDDGEKLDIAFYYRNAADEAYRRGALASPLGYWAFEQPAQGEPEPCRNVRGASLRWDMEWYAPFVRGDLALDEARTRFAMRWLSRQGAIGKMFVEPHLARRLGVSGARVRFQGCRAARHDDHVHIQLR